MEVNVWMAWRYVCVDGVEVCVCGCVWRYVCVVVCGGECVGAEVCACRCVGV